MVVSVGGVRYPQWFLLLVAVLGILSGCRSSRDLERFARRHREALNEALGLDNKRWPSDATFLSLFNKAHLQEFGQVLQAWMISQICQATAKTGPAATRKLVHPVEQARQDDKGSGGAPSLEPMVLETAVQTPGSIRSHPESVSAAGLHPSSLSRPLMS